VRFTIGLILAPAGLASLGFCARSINQHHPRPAATVERLWHHLGRGLVITAALNVIARALKRSNLAISDRLKPPYNPLDLPS
jgi:hypothetical protein